MKNLIYCLLLLSGFTAQAQLMVSNTVETPRQLVENVLVDQSVTPTNITFNGTTLNANQIRSQAAHFMTNFNGTNLGINSGVLLATGNAQVAVGPNNSGTLSQIPNAGHASGGDADLAMLSAGNTIMNATVLEFDFVATGIELNFDYVFASEEYPEFANTSYNDTFGFFLRGPGISGPFSGGAANIALLPGTTTPITINNVNSGQTNSPADCENCQYYVNNGTGTTPAVNTTIQYDGFTTVLRASATLICGETYHIKLAVANVGDNGYDSAVFLKDFRIAPLELFDGVGLDENNAVCFGTTTTLSMPDAAYFTAQNVPVPDYVTNPANYKFVWSYNATYDPTDLPAYNPAAFTIVSTILGAAAAADIALDATVGGMYSLTIYTLSDCQIAYDEIPIAFKQDVFVDPDDLVICTDDPLPLTQNIDQTALMFSGNGVALPPSMGDYVVAYYNSSEDDALNATSIGLIPDADLATYPITAPVTDIWVRLEEFSADACVTIKHFQVIIGEEPGGTLAYNVMCANSSILPVPPSTNTLTPGGTYNTSSAGLVINPTNGEIDLTTSTPGSYTVNYNLAATATCPAFAVNNVPVQIIASPAAPTAASPAVCQGTAVVLSATGLTGATFNWYTGPSGGTGSTMPPAVDTSTTGNSTYYVSQSVGAGCEGPRTLVTVTVNAIPNAPSIAPAPHYCEGTPAAAVAPISGLVSATGTVLWYDNLTDTTGNAAAPLVNANTPGTISYYVTQTVNNCESARALVEIVIDPLPAAPVPTVTSVTYCQNDTATALSATGTALKWYATATATTVIPTPTPDTSILGTTTYFVSQTLNNCEGPRASIVVNVLAPPTAPVATAIPTVCAGTAVVLTDYLPATATYRWYALPTGGTAATTPPSVNTSVAGLYEFYVAEVVGSCESARTLMSVNVNPIPAPPTIAAAPHYCIGTPNAAIAPLTALVTATGNLLWYDNPADVTGSATAPVATATNAGTLTYYVTQTVGNCESNRAAVTVVIDALPVIPPYSLAGHLPTCDQPYGQIALTPAAGTNYEFSIDGGTTYQASPLFDNLTPASTHQLMVRDLNTGCVSVVQSVTIAPIPANPPLPTFNPTQPTCAVNTGAIAFLTPVGTQYVYSVDGGVTFQAATIFAGLTPAASYTLQVKNALTGCVSATVVVPIDPARSVPVAPTASVTRQADCVIPTGEITVANPLGANLVYSIDGGVSYQASTIFAGLTPGTAYSITVRDNTSTCVSNASVVNVNPLPAAPNAPTAAVSVMPDCNITTGTVVISVPTGANFEYSFNGGLTYQASASFTLLSPGTAYSFTVRNIATQCVSLPTVINVPAIPANPAAPTANLTQPTCNTPTGTIAVTAPLGASLEYSIDGGATYQSGTGFAALPAGASYGIRVRNTLTGCVSAPTSFNILAAPTFPATPVITAANVCNGETITLTTAAVAGATYNWTGPDGFTSNLQNPTIANASPANAGLYQLVLYTTADCPSNAGTVNVLVNAIPEPTLAQDGIICFNTQTNTGDSYVLDSGLSAAQFSFQWFEQSGGSFVVIAAETQATLAVDAPGTYAVQATNLITGCISNQVQAPVGMTSPPLSVNLLTSDYFVENQMITAAVLPMGDYEYQVDNGAWQSSSTFSNLPFGDHTVRVRNRCGALEAETTLIDYPKFFTPNGDGYNDNWNIFALSGRANTKIYIFDRYGKLLKQISPDGKGWDGKFNEQLLPAADYWFTVEYEEGNAQKTFKSHFALKR